MRAMRRVSFLVSVGVLLALVSSGVAMAAPGGNSAVAHACQKGGYAGYARADGTTFRNAGECTSYAARGGTLVPLVSTPARLWIELDTDASEFLLFGEGLLPGSDVFTNLTDLVTPVPFPNSAGQADIDGNFVGSSQYVCLFEPSLFLTGTAADGTLVSSETVTPPCP